MTKRYTKYFLKLIIFWFALSYMEITLVFSEKPEIYPYIDV